MTSENLHLPASSTELQVQQAHDVKLSSADAAVPLTNKTKKMDAREFGDEF